MCIKNMIADVKDMNLDRSFNARIGISRKGEALKGVAVHHSRSTPLWKVAMFILGTVLAIMAVSCIMNKCKCKCTDNE